MKLFDTGIITDGRVAHRIGNEPVARFSHLGAFAERRLSGGLPGGVTRFPAPAGSLSRPVSIRLSF